MTIGSRAAAVGSGTERAAAVCTGGAAPAAPLGRALLDDLARVHHEHRVGDVACAREIVRDVEEREPLALLQVEHQVQDPDADRDVEHRRRLVRDQHRRLDRQRAGDRHALALPAGELVRVLRGVLLGRDEADRLEQLVDATVDAAARRARGS